MNLLLLCHGRRSDFGSFELGAGQCVQYRGNFGTPLSSSNARALVKALIENPTVLDREIATQISNYQPQDPLEGPGGFRPDISLSGDDNLLCFLMNMNTRRWVQLGSGWSSSLNQVAQDFSPPLWLNLLSCTTLGDGDVQRAYVKPELAVKSWKDVLR
jgi:hypothetical protein